MAKEVALPLLAKAVDDGPRSWRVGICEQCVEYPWNFVMACCCPCARVAQSAARAKVEPELGFRGWIAVVAVCCWVRVLIRRKYGIDDGPCAPVIDCVDHTFMSPCAIAQEGVEVDLAERGEVIVAMCMDERDDKAAASSASGSGCCFGVSESSPPDTR
ncbi:hypothetical protein CTAYLR_002881 [Chrysophaeum taylorii]|uniref:Uncharacterized protein n=1 Tax=Chrysophaeum taylorii TaxID=2483200 RepID=A0AAD7UM50_9STRA|nr:hypothetical protein CTAYLR_002881 [Chrysophaeum taylorii]